MKQGRNKGILTVPYKGWHLEIMELFWNTSKPLGWFLKAPASLQRPAPTSQGCCPPWRGALSQTGLSRTELWHLPGHAHPTGVNSDSAQPPSPDKPPSFLQRKQRTRTCHGSLPVLLLRCCVHLRVDTRAVRERLPRVGRRQASL